jgi:DNA-directed RNA polymerase subunit RPC12/RpoP
MLDEINLKDKKNMENAPEINKENINRFLCPNCGANMVFDPKSGKLACPYCAHAEEIAAEGTVGERDYYAFLERGTRQLQPMAQNAMQVRCDSCGAIVNFTPPETATVCDFCAAKIVAQPKAADPLVAPEGVLPFSVTQAGAVGNYKTWLSSLWFAPGALKDMAQADKLSSIYIPYWTYDSWTNSNYDGERGEYYYETETFYENGEQKERQVRKTHWYSVSGEVSRQFDDVCIPATTSLPEEYINRLEPWDLQELKSYEPAYLSGHKAQTYQIALDEGFERFKKIAESVIYSDARNDIGGDEQRVHNVSTRYENITFKHLLLPIYAGAYRFDGKVFQIVVNGRTGEVQGERPYSWIKITAFVLSIIALILFIAMLVSLFKR